jgi:hypothetical protein
MLIAFVPASARFLPHALRSKWLAPPLGTSRALPDIL